MAATNYLDSILQSTIPRLTSTSTAIIGTGTSFTTPKNSTTGSEYPTSITLSVSTSVFTNPVIHWEYATSSLPNTWTSLGTSTTLVVSSANFMSYIGNNTEIYYRAKATQTGFNPATSSTYVITYVKEASDAVIYDIVTSSPVITKLASDAATEGLHSSVTIYGKKYQGGTTSNYGWITVTGNGNTEATTATDVSITPYVLTPANNDSRTSYTVKLYNQQYISPSNLLDTEVINVVFSGATGSSGIPGTKIIVLTAYKWSNTGVPLATGSASYTWATGAVSALPSSGWSAYSGSAPGTGYVLYQISIIVQDISTATSTTLDWSQGTINIIGYRNDGSIGPTGASHRTAYIVTSSSTAPSLVTAGIGDVPPTNTVINQVSGWSFSATSVLQPGQYMYQVDGTYIENIVWGNPYLSNLKVGSLSAISADLGTITAGSININNGIAVIDNAGNAQFRSLEVRALDGTLILKSGELVQLDLTAANPVNVPNTISNTAITVNPDGSLNNAGTGAPLLSSLAGTIGSAQFNDDYLILNADGTDVDVELRFSRNTGGPASITWNGSLLQCSKPFISSELGINNISATPPTTTFAKQVWLDVS